MAPEGENKLTTNEVTYLESICVIRGGAGSGGGGGGGCGHDGVGARGLPVDAHGQVSDSGRH